MMRQTILGAAKAAVLTSALGFAPLAAQRDLPRASQLPAETTVLVHLDVRGLLDFTGLASRVRREYEGALRELGREGREGERLVDLIEGFGLDPTRDLHGVTVYGNESRETFAVMLTVSDRFDRVMDWMRDERVARERERDDVRFMSVDLADLGAALGAEDVDPGQEVFAFAVRRDDDRRRILIAESTSDLLRAARAWDGRGRTAADEERILARSPRRGTLVHAEIATSFAELVKDTPASGVASRLQRITASVSQDDGDLRLEVDLHTGSDKDAEAIAAVLNGLKGLLHMVDLDQDVPEEVLEAVRRMRADVDDRRVELRLTLPGDLVRDAIRENLRDVKIR